MKNKDWTGNSGVAFRILGATNHSLGEREPNDYYATSPKAVIKFMKIFQIPNVVCEPACGEGHISKVLEAYNHKVYSSDLIDRGYGKGNVDFFKTVKLPDDCNCIITNPPYKFAMEFVLHSLKLLKDDGLCIMFLKTTFLEGKNRYNKLFKYNPPLYVYQFVERVICANNGNFEQYPSSAISYCWFVWKKGYKGDTIVKWIP